MLIIFILIIILGFSITNGTTKQEDTKLTKKDVAKIIICLLCCVPVATSLLSNREYVPATIENQDDFYYFNSETLSFYEQTTSELELALNPFARKNFVKLEKAPEWFSLRDSHSHICTCGYIKGSTRWDPYCPACGKKQNPERCAQCDSRLSWTETMCSECGAHIKE